MSKINVDYIKSLIGQQDDLKIEREEEYNGGKKAILNCCVFNPNHTASAVIFFNSDGSVKYHCSHDSCKNKGITEVIKKLDPAFFTDSNYSKNSKVNKSKNKVLPKVKLLSVEDTEKKMKEWLITDYIPKADITLIAGDGGTGKTSIWCNLVAAVTTGKESLLDQALGNPFISESFGWDDPVAEDSNTNKESNERAANVIFFSSEDSVPSVLKERLERAGADLKRVSYVDCTDEAFSSIKFDSEVLESMIAEFKPALVVFDPIQSFVPADIQMGSRNAMRQCLSPLLAYGEKYGTTFVIIVHTNKKQGVSGRGRIADSADVWDIARSVLIAGDTGENEVKYLSHEKSNYGQLGITVLYKIIDGAVCYVGTSDKHDRDYVAANAILLRTAPARDDAKEAIMNFLEDGEEKKVSDLDGMIMAAGTTKATLKRAKADLKQEGKIKYRVEGYGKEKVFYVRKV